ncbi:hypothetical protein HPB49_020559 [Dermacentor silvarum]|uniref:Uncharacterized protein n=1 Tax=Dermacentor silvarum TaxID=543639 RepID=A0ACB8D063_DERSI|nr:hypothetical protein HPB49_020559 [Dermacentor silvarum]
MSGCGRIKVYLCNKCAPRSGENVAESSTKSVTAGERVDQHVWVCLAPYDQKRGRSHRSPLPKPEVVTAAAVQDDKQDGWPSAEPTWMHIVGRFKREAIGKTPFKEVEEFSMASDRGVGTKIGGDMTADLEEMARRELGETPEVKAKCIAKLRRLLADESWLECPTDEEFLVKFLRARKYDVEEALKNIRKYFRVKQETREMFENLNPYSVPFDSTCRQHRLVTVSRQRDSLGRGVVLLRLGAWNSRMCSLNDYFRVSLVQVEWLLFQQDVQIRGVVFVLDFKGLSVYHITQYTPYFISKLLYLMQDCYPIRVKALYVIHNPALFDILFAAAKRFMKPKLLQRVRLLGHDLAKLHSLLPADVIPKEAGGTHEFYDYDKLEKDLQSKAKFFDEISRYGYRMPIRRGR